MLRVWTSPIPHSQEDYLDCLWTQIQKLQRDRWLEHHIVRIYASFKSILNEGIAHNLPRYNYLFI